MRTKLTGTAFMAVILVLSFLQIEGKDFKLADFKNHSSELLSLNNAGKEFWLTFNPAHETPGGKNELKLYITSSVVTTVTVDILGKGYLRQQTTVPNEIIEFTLTPYLGQCYRKTDTVPPETEGVYPGFGVHVYADQPFICYAVTQYQESGEGYLALPVSALGKDYIVSSWADNSDNLTQFHPGYTAVVSPYDDNRVRFSLGGTPGTRTAGGTEGDSILSFNLYKGDVLLIASAGQGSDLSGSRIRSSKPVSVVSSNYCADVPENVGDCNFITEMEIPTHTWGQTYLYTPTYISRENYIKIFAKEAGTDIFRDSIQIASLRTGGGILDSGWIKLRVDLSSATPHIFSGSKPINVVQYNCFLSDSHLGGKPFMMNLTSLDQYQNEIVFCTPEKLTGERYNTHYVNVVYESSEGEFFPDDLMFAKYEDSVFNWQKVGNLSNVEGVQTIGNINDKFYYYAAIKINESGVYKLKADNPLTAYAYGFSDVDAYGFAISAAFRDLESVDTLPPNPTFDFCQCCGYMNDSPIVEDMPKDNSRSGLGMIIINVQESYNYNFSYEDFISGEDASTKWDLSVRDKNNDARAVITFTDKAGNDTTIVLEYFAMKVEVLPNVIDFGVMALGESKEVDTWIINESTTAGVVIDSISLKYNNQGFELIKPNLPFLLQPLDSIPITVGFTANENGEFKDSIGVGDTCGRFYFESKIIADVGNAIIDVSYYDYGDIPVNSSANGSIVIRNIGTIDLIITGYTGPRLQPVIFIPDLTIDPNVPLRLTPGQVFTYEVRFLPTDTMVYTDSMFFISNSIKNDNVDSVGELRGRGFKPDLIANGYNWGYKRIDRPGFPAGPYDPDNGYQVIRIMNGGTMPITIYNIKIISDVNGTAFEFDRGPLSNRQIQPYDSIIVPVKFHPTVPGPHELIIEYDNSVNSKTQTILRGIGTVPLITTEDIDFGSSVIQDYQNPKIKLVKFTNKSASDWYYGDSVTITDFEVNPSGSISTNHANWGTEGFRFNKSLISFPVKLGQGEYLEFEAEFVAVKEEQSLANLNSISDAEADVSSMWTGRGIIDEVVENSSDDNVIDIYPNPADNYLSINFKDDAPKPDFVRLFDYYGNVVYENKNIIDENLKISTSKLASGMYVLQIGSVGMRKVVVVH